MNPTQKEFEEVFSIDEVRVLQTVDDVSYLLTDGRLDIVHSNKTDQYALKVGGFTYHLVSGTNITALTAADDSSYPSYVLPNSQRDYTIQIDRVESSETLGNFETLLNQQCNVIYQASDMPDSRTPEPKEDAKMKENPEPMKEYLGPEKADLQPIKLHSEPLKESLAPEKAVLQPIKLNSEPLEVIPEVIGAPLSIRNFDGYTPSRFAKHLPDPHDRLVGEEEQPGRVGRLGMYEDENILPNKKKGGVFSQVFEKTMSGSTKVLSKGITAVGSFVEKKTTNTKELRGSKTQENSPNAGNLSEQVSPALFGSVTSVKSGNACQDNIDEIKRSANYTKKAIFKGLSSAFSKLGFKDKKSQLQGERAASDGKL